MNATVRRVLSILLLFYGIYGLTKPGEFSLIDGVNLGIHETGHIVFGPFGEFIGFAGGTILQLLMPVVFVGYFLRRGDRHSASVALWWLGENCGNVATYIADARAQELPLVGGGEHDWFYLLSATGALERDVRIAHTVRLIGWMLVIGATLWGLASADEKKELEPVVEEG
jgi:hypothetical protein